MTARTVKCRTSGDGNGWSPWSRGEPICRGERVDQALSVDDVVGVVFHNRSLDQFVEYRLASHARKIKARYLIGESGPEVTISIHAQPATAALEAFRRAVAKHDGPQATTARRARKRRQWHKVNHVTPIKGANQ